MPPRRFFFYGTLIRDSGTRIGAWIADRTSHDCAASVPGRLLAIETRTGWYPALVPGQGGERVHGRLAELILAPGELALLDRYEGREYRRLTLRARSAVSAMAPAQVYRWCAPLPRSARPVPGGDFLAWLDGTGNRAFTYRRNGL